LKSNEGSNLPAPTKGKLAFLSVSHDNRTGSVKSKIASDERDNKGAHYNKFHIWAVNIETSSKNTSNS